MKCSQFECQWWEGNRPQYPTLRINDKGFLECPRCLRSYGAATARHVLHRPDCSWWMEHNKPIDCALSYVPVCRCPVWCVLPNVDLEAVLGGDEIPGPDSFWEPLTRTWTIIQRDAALGGYYETSEWPASLGWFYWKLAEVADRRLDNVVSVAAVSHRMPKEFNPIGNEGIKTGVHGIPYDWIWENMYNEIPQDYSDYLYTVIERMDP